MVNSFLLITNVARTSVLGVAGALDCFIQQEKTEKVMVHMLEKSPHKNTTSLQFEKKQLRKLHLQWLKILKCCAVKKQEYSWILEVNERISPRSLQTTYNRRLMKDKSTQFIRYETRS